MASLLAFLFRAVTKPLPTQIRLQMSTLYYNTRGASVYSPLCCTLASLLTDKPLPKASRKSSEAPKRIHPVLSNHRVKMAFKRALKDARKFAHVFENGCYLPSAKGAFLSEWQSWQCARQRVFRPKGRDGHHYDHVDMDPRWDSFDAFIVDMGPKPGPEYTIDRVSKGYGYWPWNCRWADKQTQRDNQVLEGEQIPLPV